VLQSNPCDDEFNNYIKKIRWLGKKEFGTSEINSEEEQIIFNNAKWVQWLITHNYIALNEFRCGLFKCVTMDELVIVVNKEGHHYHLTGNGDNKELCKATYSQRELTPIKGVIEEV
jgi:hypothetical protein